jgi:histidine triad (HIT) family protein
MNECLFCRIAAGTIPADLVYQDDEFLAFRDINPQAPTHVLIIPRVHVGATSDLGDEHAEMMGRLAVTATKISRDLGLDEGGYRWVVNCGEDGCQTVPHLHVHILGGRHLGWPPG